MRETEIKLSVHASFMVPDFESTPFELVERPPLDLRATYYDTSDLRLARQGATLRHRSGEGEKPVWTLKLSLPDADARVREERNFYGPPSSVPEEARDLVTAFARSETLAPVARLRTRRRSWNVCRDGDVVAELSDDEVSILEGRRVVARFREIEAESKNGDSEQLNLIGGYLLDAGAVGTEPIPKAVRALGPQATAEPDLPRPQRVSPEDAAGVAVKSAIAASARRIIINDPLTRIGEVEGVHQMRVGARRLRSDLRTFRTLVNEEWADGLIIELKWLADALGEVRDLDVQQERLRKEGGELGEDFGALLAELAGRHARARQTLLAALKSDRYRSLLDRIIAAAKDPALSTAAGAPCEEVLPPLVSDAWSKLRKRARALSADSPEEEFHEARIRAKRARYAIEAIVPAMGKKAGEAKAFADSVADAQEVLGEHQDATVAQEIYYHFAAKTLDDGPLSFALGRLVERQAAKAAICKDRFFGVWDKLDRKKNVRWLS